MRLRRGSAHKKTLKRLSRIPTSAREIKHIYPQRLPVWAVKIAIVAPGKKKRGKGAAQGCELRPNSTISKPNAPAYRQPTTKRLIGAPSPPLSFEDSRYIPQGRAFRIVTLRWLPWLAFWSQPIGDTR